MFSRLIKLAAGVVHPSRSMRLFTPWVGLAVVMATMDPSRGATLDFMVPAVWAVLLVAKHTWGRPGIAPTQTAESMDILGKWLAGVVAHPDRRPLVGVVPVWGSGRGHLFMTGGALFLFRVRLPQTKIHQTSCCRFQQEASVSLSMEAVSCSLCHQMGESSQFTIVRTSEG